MATVFGRGFDSRRLHILYFTLFYKTSPKAPERWFRGLFIFRDKKPVAKAAVRAPFHQPCREASLLIIAREHLFGHMYIHCQVISVYFNFYGLGRLSSR